VEAGEGGGENDARGIVADASRERIHLFNRKNCRGIVAGRTTWLEMATTLNGCQFGKLRFVVDSNCQSGNPSVQNTRAWSVECVTNREGRPFVA
jgi:hypothetical protein